MVFARVSMSTAVLRNSVVHGGRRAHVLHRGRVNISRTRQLHIWKPRGTSQGNGVATFLLDPKA